MVRPPRKIGILGGMGPEATILLMQRIVSAVEARDDSDHIPMIVDNNTQVPSRIDALIHRTKDDPRPVLVQMAKGLAEVGAEILAMPCNTAHHYASSISDASDVPFLNMAALAARKARQLTYDGARIGILGSPALQIVGLYDIYLNEQGLRPLYPDNNLKLLHAIQSIKKAGPSSEEVQILMTEADKLDAKGADALLIACTEFSLISPQISSAVPVMDSLEILARELVSFSRSS